MGRKAPGRRWPAGCSRSNLYKGNVDGGADLLFRGAAAHLKVRPDPISDAGGNGGAKLCHGSGVMVALRAA
jgi:hypothetical protein